MLLVLIGVIGTAEPAVFTLARAPIPLPPTSFDGCVFSANHAQGYVEELRAISIGGRTAVIERWSQAARGVLRAMAANSQGDIAWVEDHWNSSGDEFHEIKIRQRGGTIVSLGRGTGAGLWGNTIGKNLAISPEGRSVAAVTRLHWERSHGRSWLVGNPTIRRIGQDKPEIHPGRAIDTGLSLTTDGTLIFAGLVELRDLPPAADRHLVTSLNDAALVYAISSLKDGIVRRLAAGTEPVLSTDGRFVLFGDDNGRYVLLTLADSSGREVRLSGVEGRIVALVNDRYVVFEGAPAVGERRTSPYGSPLVRPTVLLPVQVTDLLTNQTVAITEPLDPRDALAYTPARCPFDR